MDAYVDVFCGGLAHEAPVFIVGGATPKPKGADLDFLTSRPGEEVLAY